MTEKSIYKIQGKCYTIALCCDFKSLLIANEHTKGVKRKPRVFSKSVGGANERSLRAGNLFVNNPFV